MNIVNIPTFNQSPALFYDFYRPFVLPPVEPAKPTIYWLKWRKAALSRELSPKT